MSPPDRLKVTWNGSSRLKHRGLFQRLDQRVHGDAGTEPAKRTRYVVMATVGNYVQLANVTPGKYAGRIIGDEMPVDGPSLGLSRIAVIAP